MPPLTRLRVGSLEALAAQMRFAPPAALRRQAFAAEALAAEIDPDRNYTLGWIARRLTGYRLDAGLMDAEEIIIGAALVAELPAMVERLSDRAGLTAEDLGPGALSLAALCARWGVDRKTIERRRRQGLIGFRVGVPGKNAARKRLVFRLAAVERFEARLPAPARSRRGRIRGMEAERLLALAARCRRRFGWSMHQTAERLARRTGRSVEGVRGLLARSDAKARSRLFTERGPLTGREHAVIERALRRGIPAGALAGRIGRSRASIHRAALEGRAALLRTLDLSGPILPTFHRADAGEVLLAPAIVRASAPLDLDREPAAAWEEARTLAAPEEADERALAAAMAFLRHRAARAVAALPAHSTSATALDEIETDLRWHSLTQARLARLGFRLAALTVEERLGAPPASLPWAESAMLLRISARALLIAAWTFDPSVTGERFAAVATAALLPALARPAARSAIGGLPRSGGAAAARARKPRDAATSLVAEPDLDAAHPWSRWLDPPQALRREIAAREWLAPQQAEALAWRFGLARADGSRAPPCTRAAAGKQVGESEVWLARLERAAWRRGLCLPARASLHPRPARRSSTSSR